MAIFHQTTVSLHDMQASCVFWHVILMFTLYSMNTTKNNSGELISGTVSLGASRSSWWSCDTWSANIWGKAKACHSMSITKNSGVVIIFSTFFHSVPNTLFWIFCALFF